MKIMSSKPEPDYTKLYDNVRNQNEKLRKEVERLTIERDQAIKDLREALFIKAEAIAREVKDQEQRFATSDSNVITNAIMDLRKLLLKPGVKIRKIKTVIMGDTIIEVQYET
jgi:ribosomal protein L9